MGAGLLALFALAFLPAGAAAAVPADTPHASLADAFNNVGISPEANPTVGDLDGDGDSYSAEEMVKAGAAPGATITYADATFTWPNVASGEPDNVSASGQTVTISGSGGTLAFLGAAIGSNIHGDVTVDYADGSSSRESITFANWSAKGGADKAITMDHRNTPNGPANLGHGYFVFYDAIPLTAGKTVSTVTLPNVPALHIFAMTIAGSGGTSGTAPQLTSGSPDNAMVGSPYSFTVAATGTPAPTFQVTAGSLPDGLQLNATTGVISGTPKARGESSFTITAHNGNAPDAVAGYTITTIEQYPNYAPTPPMGWNNWTYYQRNIDEDVILGNARALVSNGLAAKGYDYVTTDDAWMQKTRDADGNLVADPVKFPHGMAYIGEQLHKMGLKFGIYEDAGTKTCGGYPGSWGHFAQDAALFASWKVDYVKMDGCNFATVDGMSTEDVARQAYTQMSMAMMDTGRPMVFSISAPDYFRSDTTTWHRVIAWSSQLGNLWREGTDIAHEQDSNKWQSIMKNYHYNVDDAIADLQSPGRWNDPDFLLAGNSGLTTDEISSQMSLWAMMASPLISSTDVSKLTPAQVGVLGNADVIAVDQDSLGVQGRVVAQGDDYDVLTKPLAGGDYAVAVLNTASSAQTVTTNLTELGIPASPSFVVTDLNSKKASQTTGALSINVRPHATMIYRVHAGTADVPPSTGITVHAGDTANGVTSYHVTLSNNSAVALDDVELSLTTPTGWTVKAAHARIGHLAASGTADADFTVTSSQPTTTGNVTNTLIASATYTYGSGTAGSVSADVTVTTFGVPYAHLADAFNNVGITAESDPSPGSFDSKGDSYSAEEMVAAGAAPGAAVSYDGATFAWPDVAPGTADNVVPDRQLIALRGAGTTLAFLGASSDTSAPSGDVTVTYTDGSTSHGTISFANWSTAGGDKKAIVMDHRNTPSGPANFGHGYYVFSDSIPLTAGKTVATVTLPEVPAMHLFAMSIAGAGEPAAPTVSLSASHVVAGGAVVVSLDAFGAGAAATVSLHSDVIDLANVTTDAIGHASVAVTIPADAPIGDHTIVVTQGDLTASAALVVTAAPGGSGDDPGDRATSGSAQDPSLADTGSTLSVGAGILAALMLLLGIPAIVFRRAVRRG